jgi:hypothetical protein
MKKIFLALGLIIFLFPLMSSYSYEQESYSSPGTFVDKWEYREDNHGDHTGFELTHTYTVPRQSYYYESSNKESKPENYYLSRHRFKPFYSSSRASSNYAFNSAVKDYRDSSRYNFARNQYRGF